MGTRVGKVRRKGKVRRGATRPGRGPSDPPLLTCCMIVKDEAQMLPRCLASLAGVVDEIVVVDTGSSDGTVKLAEEAGARVFHQPWQDDFSAPRNLAVAEARGRWVLLLDADECLGPKSGQALLAGIGRDDFDCGLLPWREANRLDATVEQVLSGEAAIDAACLLPRLYRRFDGLSWEGAVHEHVNRWLGRGNKRVRRLPEAAIAHFGGVPALREVKGKSERNLKLLEKRCAQSSEDCAAHGYLAYALHGTGESKRAFEVIEQAWLSLTSQMSNPSSVALPPSSVSIAVLYGSFLREQGQIGAAIEVLLQCLEWNRGRVDEAHPGVHFQLGGCYEMAATRLPGDVRLPEFLSLAQKYYGVCLSAGNRLFLEVVNPTDCTGGLAWMRLGAVALMAGDPESALQAYGKARDGGQDGAELRLGMAEAKLGAGEPRRCIEMLATVQGECSDIATLAALAHRELGELGATLRFAKQAVQRMGSLPFIAGHRQRRLSALCESMQQIQEKVG